MVEIGERTFIVKPLRAGNPTIGAGGERRPRENALFEHVLLRWQSRRGPAAVASENSIHLTRSHRRIRTRSSDDCNRPIVRPYAVRLLQAAIAAGSRNPNTAASAQHPSAARAAPSAAFALDRPRPVHLALSSLPPHS